MQYKGINKEKILEVQKVKLVNTDAYKNLTEKDFIDLIKDDEKFNAVHRAIEIHAKQVMNDTELSIICEIALLYLKDLKEKESYKKGLEDAWELAKKLWLPTSYGGMIDTEVEKIFACDYFAISKNYTPQEALAKLEAYEKEKAEIHVGDVIRHAYYGLVVVTQIKDDYCRVLASDCTSFTLLKSSLVKTDKHVDIQPIFDLLNDSLKGDIDEK